MQFNLDKCPGCQAELISKNENGRKTLICSSNKLFINDTLKKFKNFNCFDYYIETGYIISINRYLSIDDKFLSLEFKSNTDSYNQNTILQRLMSGFYHFNDKPYLSFKKPNLELMFLSNSKLENKIKSYLILK